MDDPGALDDELTHELHPDDRRLVVTASPLNAEAAHPALAAPITPPAAHYVRSNFETPALDDGALIAVEGAVAEPFTLAARDLGALPQRSVTVTMECAGNNRLQMAPLPHGEPWSYGAVSTASWSGPSLATLLERAGLRDDVVEILVAGADRGTPRGAGGPTRFARALPLDKARELDVIVAIEMNGHPLPHEHGAPARLIVPGWYGMASVKWVARIAALTEPFTGWFQTDRYVYKVGRDTRPVDVMRVKSMIVAPEAGTGVAHGRVGVWGWAWSGAAPIAGVEVALDGGEWQPAALDPALAPHAWRRFAVGIDVPEPGRHVVCARARDAAGRAQPEVAAWNEHGYGNNAVAPVVFYAF
ncbi:MAG TPA: molybdopterin-dependent oxidoreductase [Polyangia bacterium]|jgi:DMSO/TMAO reductase YedYZ molybdopterin-dependent catalytic subunit